MAISVASNNDNDIFLTVDKNLSLVRDIYAVAQDCEHSMKALFNEMIYAYDRGIPYFDVVFDNLNIPQFEGIGILTLLVVPNVTNVSNFKAEFIGNQLNYAATIETIYGTQDIAGSIQ